jgi:hypothetical protein
VPPLTFSGAQADLIALPTDRRIFLEGVAGTGKTTAGVARLLRLLVEDVPADAILVLTPQRTLAAPFTDTLRGPAAPAGGEVTVLTLGGLAQRMVEIFWPVIAAEAGFAQPDRPPTFLTLETAQYFMARLVGPLLADGYFDSISIDRNRLYSQILDNLNKAAAVGFPHSEIGARLTAAWVGESAQTRVYAEAQECADRFRAHCLAHNLLDFSLQYELFAQRLWPLPACRDYLTRRYTHLIVDNVEEDTPVAHDLLAAWLPTCASALVIYDWEAGYRRFLGADPRGAYRLKTLCNKHVTLTDSFVTSPDVQALEDRLARALGAKRSGEPVAVVMGRGRARIDASEMSFDAQPAEPAAPALPSDAAGVRPALDFTSHRYHPEMLDWVADEIAHLVHGRGVAPKQIAVLAPFLGSGLRFALDNRLTARDIPVRSHRPSRSLREEPVTACLLTLAVLAHPAWGAPPSKFDVAYALTRAIDEMDLVRAQLLTEVVYRVRDGAPILGSFADIEPAMQERITFLLGGRYEGLRAWLTARADERRMTNDERRRRSNPGPSSFVLRPSSDLDHFLARLFGELLSQPGYGFHGNFSAGEVTANVIESARKFRQVMARSASHNVVILSGPETSRPVHAHASEESGVQRREILRSTQDDTKRAKSLAQEYIALVQEGVVAAQYVRSWRRQPTDAVLLAPAYTFLMTNQPVEHQFWLDVGSSGWWERLNQPLTQPYVLSRTWRAGAQWTDLDEYAARQEALYCLALGLVRRCRTQIHLGLSELGEQGVEQRGPLLRAIQRVLRSSNQ